MNSEKHYRSDEIKYRIDTAIQLQLLENINGNNDKNVENALLAAQTKLHEQFGIEAF